MASARHGTGVRQTAALVSNTSNMQTQPRHVLSAAFWLRMQHRCAARSHRLGPWHPSFSVARDQTGRRRLLSARSSGEQPQHMGSGQTDRRRLQSARSSGEHAQKQRKRSRPLRQRKRNRGKQRQRLSCRPQPYEPSKRRPIKPIGRNVKLQRWLAADVAAAPSRATTSSCRRNRGDEPLRK